MTLSTILIFCCDTGIWQSKMTQIDRTGIRGLYYYQVVGGPVHPGSGERHEVQVCEHAILRGIFKSLHENSFTLKTNTISHKYL